MSRLRAPFVVTLSTLSALSACSSTEAEPAASVDSSLDARADDDLPDVSVDAASDTVADARDATSDVADTTLPPNPAGCPSGDPGFGPFHQACKIADTIRCRYRDDCPNRPSDAGAAINEYACHDDGSGAHWTLVSPAYTPDCPKVEPTAGSACPCSPHMQYIACLYGKCEDFTSSFANCEGPEELEHAWRVTPTSCNPPEPDGGLDGDTHD